MEHFYREIIDYMRGAGKRLASNAGSTRDIGVTKQYLTDEDIRIERDLKNLIDRLGPDHSVFAEEENDDFRGTSNVWAIDPISSTKNYIEGLPHYAIVVTHLLHGEAQFAAVYDPSSEELFTAQRNRGAYVNDSKLTMPEDLSGPILFRISHQWKDGDRARTIQESLEQYELQTNTDSMAINYCALAQGKVAGFVCLAKDSFPNFAGTLIVNEAGGIAANEYGNTDIDPSDRIFVAASRTRFSELLGVITAVHAR